MLTNDMASFEQPGPGCVIWMLLLTLEGSQMGIVFKFTISFYVSFFLFFFFFLHISYIFEWNLLTRPAKRFGIDCYP